MWNILFMSVDYSPHCVAPYFVRSAKTIGYFNGMECELVKVTGKEKTSLTISPAGSYH
jgi:hypothetical protein